MEKLGQVIRKTPDAYFGMIGVIEVVVLLEIATLLYNVSIPFDFFTCWVSSLGVGPNGAAQLFTVGLVVAGLLFIPFVLSLFFFLKSNATHARGSTWTGLLASCVSIFGAILAGIFNYHDAGSVHVLASNLFFIGATVFIITFSIAIHRHHALPRYLKLSLIIAVILFAFLYPVLFISATNYFPGQVLTIERWLEFTTSDSLALGWVRLFEWWSLYAIFAWILLASVYLLRETRPKSVDAAKPL